MPINTGYTPTISEAQKCVNTITTCRVMGNEYMRNQVRSAIAKLRELRHYADVLGVDPTDMSDTPTPGAVDDEAGYMRAGF